jgi:hypothetical protein
MITPPIMRADPSTDDQAKKVYTDRLCFVGSAK